MLNWILIQLVVTQRFYQRICQCVICRDVVQYHVALFKSVVLNRRVYDVGENLFIVSALKALQSNRNILKIEFKVEELSLYIPDCVAVRGSLDIADKMYSRRR